MLNAKEIRVDAEFTLCSISVLADVLKTGKQLLIILRELLVFLNMWAYII